jgi:hypothetical protein
VTGEALDTTLAAIDIGTNSIHLVVAHLVNGDRVETLTTEREMDRPPAAQHVALNDRCGETRLPIASWSASDGETSLLIQQRGRRVVKHGELGSVERL